MSLKEGEKVHIGDGVYVSFDGYHLWLSTEREHGTHVIALEPQVFIALTAIADDVWKVKDG